MKSRKMVDACKIGDIESIKSLIQSGDIINNTALRVAAENGKTEVIKYLIEYTQAGHNGSASTSRRETSSTPIEKSAWGSAESRYHTALCAAAGGGHLDIVELLTDIIGKDIIRGIGDRGAVKAACKGHLHIVKYLVENVHNMFADHRGIIWSAAANGHLHILKYIASIGHLVRHISDDAICVAGANGHLSVVMYLVEHGANIHADHTHCLRMAALNGHLDIVKYAVSVGADHRDSDDWAVRWAAYNGHLSVVKYLVSIGSDVCVYDNYSICLAASNGHLPVVMYLAETGADIHARSNIAVRWASGNGHFEVVKFLVDKGAPTEDISQKAKSYLAFRTKMEEVRRIRAQKKIYFWWIPICYDMNRDSGRRMAQRNLEYYLKIGVVDGNADNVVNGNCG